MNCGTSGLTNCLGLFYKPLAEAFTTPEKAVGVSDAALGRTIQMVVVAFVVVLCGKLLVKHYKKALYLSSVFYCVYFLLMSFAGSIVQIYIVQGLAGFVVAILQNLCIIFTINRWFYRKKGTAFSIFSACAGISSMFFNSVTGNIIDRFGWQWGYRFFAVCGFVLTFSAAIIMQESPEACGLKPYGWEADESAARAEGADMTRASEVSTDSRPLRRRPELYLMIFLRQQTK